MEQEITNAESFVNEFDQQDFLSASKSTTQNFPVQLVIAIAALLCAVPIAFAIYYISAAWFEQPEKAVKIIGAMFAVLLVLPLAFYLIRTRREAKVDELGLIFFGTALILLAAIYFYRASFYVNFSADFFIWSESDFVNDILKFRQGYPIFTEEANNESFTYVPGAQLLTYFLAWVVGLPTSVSAFRAVQIFYTLLAAIFAFLCCRRLVRFVSPDDSKIADSPIWGVVWLTGLFLLATNSLTNPFTHLLHNDALAQLVCVAAYWLLLEYEATGDKRILWLMCLVPPIGFWVKQSLIIWAVLYAGYFLFFGQQRSYKKILLFAFATFGLTGISIFIGYALWQDNFIYWVFTVLGAHGVSPLLSFKHLLDVWIYFAAGLAGGAILLMFVEDKGASKKTFGHWLIWLTLISIETYTSGVAWMLNHIGPGSLIAGIWFFAALATLWTRVINSATIKTATPNDWLRVGVSAAVLCLLMNGFGAARVPIAPFDAVDAERYRHEIVSEFIGNSPERVLLDFGTWNYLASETVMKDRAPTIGERGWSQTGDFSGILSRLKQKHYRKILVRNLHSPDFWYDHHSWKRSSGIRQALLENYREIGSIKPVAGVKADEMPYGFQEISILVPLGD